VIVAVGATPSYVTVIVSAPTFPAASRARTTMTLFPDARATPTAAQLVVPLAVPDAPVAWFVHVTAVTPMPSEAVPPRSSSEDDAEYVGEEVGVVIVHTGAAES
jgi:hypothetical protein